MRLFTSALSLALLVSLAALSMSCDEGDRGGTLNVFIVEATPERGHAPLEVDFEVDFALDADAETAITWNFGDGSTITNQRATSHTYFQPGTYTATVTVTDRETGESGQDERIIEILPTTDLEVSSLQGAPIQVTAGQNLSVQYNLRNTSENAVETPFAVVVFLTTNENADAGDLDEFLILDREIVDDVGAAGSSSDILDVNLEALVPDSVPSGQYYLGVLADADQEVGEDSEDNNLQLSASTFTVRNPRTDGPDLVPTNVVVNPKRTRILSSLSVDFTVENRGVASALLFRYALFLSDDELFEPDLDTFLLVGEVPGVAAGGDFDVDDVLVPINPAITEPGDYYIFVVIDPEDELLELDDGNNTERSATPISVTDEPILDADIVVQDFQIDPVSTFLGGSLLTTVEIVNQGSQPTGSFVCTLYLSENQTLELEEDLVLTSLNIFELFGDSTEVIEQITTIPSFFKAGNYYAFVFCDASGVVVEFDENNNVQRFPEPLSVAITAEVDLEPTDVRIEPASPITSGEDVTLRFDACNNGSTGSSPVLLRVFMDQTIDPSPDDNIVFESVLPGLEPGTCEPFEATFPITCQPWIEDYQLVVQVDGRGLLDETDEANNIAGLPGGITVEGERCFCDNSVGEENDFSSVPFPLVVGDNTGLALCSGDADWYSVALEAKDSLRATLVSDPDFGKLDLILYDPSKQRLETSSGDTGREVVDTYLVPFAGDYLLQVVPAEPGAINTYDIEIDIDTPVTDALDVSVADLVPATETPDLNAPFDLSFAVLNLSDAELTTPFRVSLLLSQDTLVDEADVELDQFEVTSMAALERLELVRPITIPGDTESGTWRVLAEVDINDAITEASEDNNTSASPPLTIDSACFDPLEPNDSLSDAVDVTPQDVDPAPGPSFPGLVVCKSNPDFYRVQALNGQQLRFTATTDASTTDLDIVLRAADGSEITASRTTNDTEEILLPVVVGDQDLYLEVLQHPSQFNPERSTYDLTITAVPADEQLVCNAAFEPNDTFEAATSLLDADGLGAEIATCPKSDDDYYKVNLTAGSFIEIALVTDSRDLRASLYDPNRNFIQTLFNPTAETIAYTAPTSGTYFLKVFSGAGASRQEVYSLDVTGLDGADLFAENLLLSPTTLIAGNRVSYSASIVNLGSVDTDPFDVHVVLSEDALIDASDTVIATHEGLAGVPSQGAFTLNGKALIPVDQAGGVYQLGLILDPDDTLAELNEFNNNTAVESLQVVATCTNDTLDQAANNDTLDAASPLGATGIDATICPGDEDWFSFDLARDEAVTVDVAFTHADGDLDLAIYNSRGELVADSASLDDDESASFSASQAGTFYAQVIGFQGTTSNTYTISLTRP